ncbi:MAG: sugar transferase [Phycisphaerae bacterium]
MGLDATRGSAVIGHSAPALAPPWRGYPRLVRADSSSAAGPSGWLSTLGATLVELPWPVWAVLDAALIAAGVHLGYELFVWQPGGGWLKFGAWETCLIHAPAIVLAGLIFGLYEQQTLLRGSRIVARSFLATIGAVIASYIVISLLMYGLHSRRVLLLAGLLHLGAASSVRLLVCWSVHTYCRRFLIVGTDRRSQLATREHDDGLSRRYRLAGYVGLEPVETGREIKGHRVLGTIDQLEEICVLHQIHEVVVGPGVARNPRVLERTLGCLRLGCRVTNLSTFYEQVLSEVPLAHLEPDWFLFADLKHYRETQLILKRAVDVAMALLVMLLTAPLWPLIALLVRLDSPGPALFHQRRVGLNGRVFRLHKFRTMHVESEPGGHVWAAKDDPRVTRVGWYLRRSRLDELPQLWNILLGQMSIVGPRPERPEFVEELSRSIPFYHERHLVKPGLTGWAQINYRYGASVEDARRKLQLDLWYLKHMSLELDFLVLLRTVGTMCLGSR